MILPIVLGYGAELVESTFAFDRYHNQIRHASLASAWSAWAQHGRYLGALLNILTLGSVSPFLHLAVALAGLTLGAWTFIAALRPEPRVGIPADLLIAVPLVVLYPFFFDILAFTSVRLSVAAGCLSAASAVGIALHRRDVSSYLLGTLLLTSSLALYQSTFNIALIAIVFSSLVHILATNSLRSAMVARLFPGLRLALGSLLLYLFILKVILVDHARFDIDYRYPADAAEVFALLQAYSAATVELLFREQSFFPLPAKIGLAAIFAGVLAGIARRVLGRQLTAVNAAFACLLLAAALVSSFGVCLPFYPPVRYIQYRIFTPFAFFSGGMLAVALIVNGGLIKKVVRVMACAVIYVFVFNIALAHEYLALMNEADRVTALQIVSRLKSDAGFQPGLPLVVVGHLPQHVAFPLGGTFRSVNERQIWMFTSVYSVFATAWSKERVLMAYLPFQVPTSTDRAAALRYAADAACWPAPGSVRIVDGVMVVVLDTKEARGVSCHGNPLRARGTSW